MKPISSLVVTSLQLAATFRLPAPLILTGYAVMSATTGVSHATDCTWNVASGNWNVAGSWTPSIPVSAGTDNVIFSSAAVGGSPVTVTFDGNRIVNSVTFESSSTTLLTAVAGSNRNLTMAAGLTVNSDAGAVTLSTAANASNGLQISADQVWTNNGTLSITSIIRTSVPTDARTLTITGSGSTDISGAGRFREILSLIKDGTGTLTLGGTPNNYTYTGTLAIKAGTLSIGAINNISTNGLLGNNATPIPLGDTGSVTGTLSYTGSTASSTRPFTLATGGTGAFAVTNSGTILTLHGAVDGSGALEKSGAGTLVFSTDKTYTGATVVSGGTLLVNGTTDPTSAVSVTAGTLGGTGTVGGSISVASGGSVAPGTATSIGTLNTSGNVVLASGAVFDVEIDTNSTITDLLNTGGDLNLAGASLTVANLGSATPGSFEVFTIATYAGTLSGTFNGLPEGATVPIAGRNYTLRYADGFGDNNITLTAPEVIGTPYDDWAMTNITNTDPLADATPAGDPDKDGASNLTEFAFNGNPLSGSDSGRIYLLTADSDFDSPDSGKELILTVAVRSGAPAFSGSPSPDSAVDAITYTIEGSTTLGGFDTTVNVVPTPVITDLPPPGSGYEYRSFSLAGSNGLPGKGFLRAKVSN